MKHTELCKMCICTASQHLKDETQAKDSVCRDPSTSSDAGTTPIAAAGCSIGIIDASTVALLP